MVESLDVAPAEVFLEYVPASEFTSQPFSAITSERLLFYFTQRHLQPLYDQTPEKFTALGHSNPMFYRKFDDGLDALTQVEPSALEQAQADIERLRQATGLEQLGRVDFPLDIHTTILFWQHTDREVFDTFIADPISSYLDSIRSFMRSAGQNANSYEARTKEINWKIRMGDMKPDEQTQTDMDRWQVLRREWDQKKLDAAYALVQEAIKLGCSDVVDVTYDDHDSTYSVGARLSDRELNDIFNVSHVLARDFNWTAICHERALAEQLAIAHAYGLERPVLETAFGLVNYRDMPSIEDV